MLTAENLEYSNLFPRGAVAWGPGRRARERVGCRVFDLLRPPRPPPPSTHYNRTRRKLFKKDSLTEKIVPHPSWLSPSHWNSGDWVRFIHRLVPEQFASLLFAAIATIHLGSAKRRVFVFDCCCPLILAALLALLSIFQLLEKWVLQGLNTEQLGEQL